MRRGAVAIAVAVASILVGKPAPGAPVPEREPKLLSDAFACEALTNAVERLACYDKTIGAMKHAYSSQDLIVADREGIRKAKRSLFGLSLPNFDLLGHARDSEDSEITANLLTADFRPDGSLSLSLDGGGSWIQVDDNTVPIRPEPGTPVTVKRGALGSYVVSFSRYSFKAHRVN